MDRTSYDAYTLLANIDGVKTSLDLWCGVLGGLTAYADVQTFAREMGGGMAIGDHSIKGGGG